jgi:hypothetical protein
MRTAERTALIVDRLANSPTYARDRFLDDPKRHAPRPHAMQQFLQLLATQDGAAGGWLAARGWTAEDQRALRTKLTR